jgi:hypothetical protein
MPQQALALANSKIALTEARSLASRFSECKDDQTFITRAYEKILGREPKAEELQACAEFLKKEDPKKGRENLALVLFNHNDFVTVR